MKKNLIKFRFSRIRRRLFAIIFAILLLFFVLVTVFSKPLLFRTFSYQTYRNLSATADAVNECIPGSVTYYFDLSSIAGNNNVSFEIINPDGTVAYASDYDIIERFEANDRGTVISEVQKNAP